MSKAPDPVDTRDAVAEVHEWIRGLARAMSRGTAESEVPKPPRKAIANAVRLTARTLEHEAPGHSVEVRVPPFVAVQCIDGPRHTRGTPPNVVECTPETWLLVATGCISWEDAIGAPGTEVSGTRAGEVARWLPIVQVGEG